MDFINRFWLSECPLLFMMGLDGCTWMEGQPSVQPSVSLWGFPGTGTKRRLELVSPLQSHKYRAVWETGPVLGMLQHLHLLFLLKAGSVGRGIRAELICSEYRRAVHSLQLSWWSPNTKHGHGDG